MARGGGGGGGGGRGGYGGRGGRGGGRGGSHSNISAMLDPLDEEMLSNFQSMKQDIIATWERFSGNEGQMTIVHHYIIPVSQSFVAFAKEEWPYTGEPDQYLEAVMEAYDPEIIERAFSDTLYELYDTIAGYWEGAMVAQDEHNSIMGGVVVVHSTNPPWVA